MLLRITYIILGDARIHLIDNDTVLDDAAPDEETNTGANQQRCYHLMQENRRITLLTTQRTVHFHYDVCKLRSLLYSVPEITHMFASLP